MVAADLRLVGSLGAEGRVLGVDDDRPGDGVGALGGGLRAAEHLDAVDVPDRGRAEEHLVVVQVVAIEVDRRPRHCAAPEHVLPVVRALGVLAADDRRAHRVGVDHVGTAIDHLGDRGVAGLLAVDVAGAGERYRGRRVLQRAFTFLAGHDQRLEGGGFVLGGRVFPGQCRWRGEQGGQRDDADSPVERAVRAGVQGSSPNGNDSLYIQAITPPEHSSMGNRFLIAKYEISYTRPFRGAPPPRGIGIMGAARATAARTEAYGSTVVRRPSR